MYIAPDLDNAMLFAAFWTVFPWREGTGCVYRVAPDAAVPDRGGCAEGTCGQVVVTEVITPDGVTREQGYALPGVFGYLVARQDLYRQARRDWFPQPAGAVVLP